MVKRCYAKGAEVVVREQCVADSRNSERIVERTVVAWVPVEIEVVARPIELKMDNRAAGHAMHLAHHVSASVVRNVHQHAGRERDVERAAFAANKRVTMIESGANGQNNETVIEKTCRQEVERWPS